MSAFWAKIYSNLKATWTHKKKVVFIIGATGSGKSKLSIDLATHFKAEIVNSDKMQVYEGLPIVTNKVTKEEQRGIPHHLLGVLNMNEDFTAYDFCLEATKAIESIIQNGRLPIVAGGSSTYIQALVGDERFQFRSKYDCIFIWIDVALDMLHSSVANRVDEMVNSGLVDEVRGIFEPKADYNRGIRRSIGVSEMVQYLTLEPHVEEETRKKLLELAIGRIKNNTCKLTVRQLEKIEQFRNQAEWHVCRIDATKVFFSQGQERRLLWNKIVLAPCVQMVERFIRDGSNLSSPVSAATAPYN